MLLHAQAQYIPIPIGTYNRRRSTSPLSHSNLRLASFHSFIHPFIHPSIHSFIHSFIQIVDAYSQHQMRDLSQDHCDRKQLPITNGLFNLSWPCPPVASLASTYHKLKLLLLVLLRQEADHQEHSRLPPGGKSTHSG